MHILCGVSYVLAEEFDLVRRSNVAHGHCKPVEYFFAGGNEGIARYNVAAAGGDGRPFSVCPKLADALASVIAMGILFLRTSSRYESR